MDIAGIAGSTWDWLGENWEGITAASALLVASGSLYVDRRHNRLSVRPHLTAKTSSSEPDKRIEAIIRNNGIGPALIKSFSLLLDRQPIQNCATQQGIKAAIEPLMEGYQRRLTIGILGPGASVAPNEAFVMLEIELLQSEPKALAPLLAKLDRLDLVVKYECFYGQTYHLDTRTG